MGAVSRLEPRRGASVALGLRRAARWADRLTARLRHAAGPATAEGRPLRIAVPSALPSSRRSFLMDGCHGRDAVAATVAADFDAFEPPMPAAFLTLVHDLGGTVLDVGANSGLYSLLATFADPDASVVAFEPFPPVAQLLGRNLRSNRVDGRVRVVEQAVSDRPGTAELFVPDAAHGLVETSCSLNGSFKEHVSGAVPVTVTTLDGYLQEHPVHQPVTVLKVDVESLEHAVLAGARATLAAHRPVVFFEVLHIGDPDAIDHLRRDLDYVDVRLAPGRLVVGDAVRHDPDAWNHLLVPAERADAVLSLLGGLGLSATAP